MSNVFVKLPTDPLTKLFIGSVGHLVIWSCDKYIRHRTWDIPASDIGRHSNSCRKLQAENDRLGGQPVSQIRLLNDVYDDRYRCQRSNDHQRPACTLSLILVELFRKKQTDTCAQRRTSTAYQSNFRDRQSSF